MVRGHVFIAGRVQGVSFRYYAKRKAESLGLGGWIRNVSDAKLQIPSAKSETFTGVEAVFEGPKAKVTEMLKWCQRGSPSAQVSSVEVIWETPEKLSSFEIREGV